MKSLGLSIGLFLFSSLLFAQQSEDDWISGIYSVKIRGKLKELYIYKNNEQITGKFVSYKGRSRDKVLDEYYFETNNNLTGYHGMLKKGLYDGVKPIVYKKNGKKILHLKTFKGNRRGEIQIVLTVKKKNKSIVSCYGSGGKGPLGIIWKDYKMKRDYSSQVFKSFVMNHYSSRVLSKSNNNIFKLYDSSLGKKSYQRQFDSDNFKLKTSFLKVEDLTKKEEINAYFVTRFRYDLNQQRLRTIDTYLSKLKENVKRDLPQLKKIHVATKKGGNTVIVIDLTSKGRAILTSYAKKKDEQVIEAINNRIIAKRKRKERAAANELMKAANQRTKLVQGINQANQKSTLPSNLKISSESWLNTLIGSIKNNRELNDVKKFIGGMELFTGVKTGLFKKQTEHQFLKGLERSIPGLNDLVNLYNQNEYQVKNNRQLASMIRGYVYALQSNCYLSNDAITIKYTKTTTVTQDKYFGLLYAGTSSNNYTKVKRVKVPKRFYNAYVAIENKEYRYKSSSGYGYFVNIMKEFIREKGCNSKKVMQLDVQLLKVYDKRLKL